MDAQSSLRSCSSFSYWVLKQTATIFLGCHWVRLCSPHPQNIWPFPLSLPKGHCDIFCLCSLWGFDFCACRSVLPTVTPKLSTASMSPTGVLDVCFRQTRVNTPFFSCSRSKRCADTRLSHAPTPPQLVNACRQAAMPSDCLSCLNVGSLRRFQEE